MRITDSQPPFSIGLAILVFYRHDWCIVFTRCFSTDNEHFISYHELPSDLKVSAILFHARCYQWLQCYVYVYWLYFYSHPIFLPLKCFIIQVVGPDTSSVNIEMCVWYIVFLFFMYLDLYFFNILYTLYTWIHLFFYMFAELAVILLLSSGPMAFWRTTGSPDGLIHACRCVGPTLYGEYPG